jgi:hypothetical protein
MTNPCAFCLTPIPRNYCQDCGITTHDPSECAPDHHCVIHDPSDHPMRSWDMVLRASGLVERICPKHGIGHPDPDSLAYFVREHGMDYLGIHGCCGCCFEGK